MPSAIPHPRRAARDLRPAARAAHLVQVMLDPLRRRCRDLLLLIRTRDTPVSGAGQIPAARALALRVVILGPVRELPPHRRARAARLLPPVPLLLHPFPGPPCLRGIFRPGRSSADGGMDELPLFRDPARSAAASRSRRERPAPPKPRSAPPALRSAHHADPRMAPPARIGHSPQSSRKTPLRHRSDTTPAAKM
jgi:hypothetical protein